MKSSGKYPLTGEVHVGEFYLGEEERIIDRNPKGKQKLFVVALEIVKGGVRRACAQVIDDASLIFFRPFFEKHISKAATVVTDEWNGYKPLTGDYNIEQRRSDGKAFPQMHIHIMNINGWIRGMYHHCSKEHMQGYLDEYHFRSNRRVYMHTIFDMLTCRMVSNQPLAYCQRT